MTSERPSDAVLAELAARRDEPGAAAAYLVAAAVVEALRELEERVAGELDALRDALAAP